MIGKRFYSRRIGRLAGLALLFAVLTGAADTGADSRKRGGIKGADDRVAVDVSRYPWKTVGRLNLDGRGFCTATLVGPARVLTAAHCLWNQRTGRYHRPNTVVFLAGYDKGRWAAAARGIRLSISQTFDPTAPPGPPRAATDWAYVMLDTPLGEEFSYLNISNSSIDLLMKNIENGSPLVQVGYSRDRQYVLTKNDPCHLVGRIADTGLWAHECDAMTGNSGSPILLRAGTTFHIAAIHIATAQAADGRWIGIALPGRFLKKSATMEIAP